MCKLSFGIVCKGRRAAYSLGQPVGEALGTLGLGRRPGGRVGRLYIVVLGHFGPHPRELSLAETAPRKWCDRPSHLDGVSKAMVSLSICFCTPQNDDHFFTIFGQGPSEPRNRPKHDDHFCTIF